MMKKTRTPEQINMNKNIGLRDKEYKCAFPGVSDPGSSYILSSYPHSGPNILFHELWLISVFKEIIVHDISKPGMYSG